MLIHVDSRDARACRVVGPDSGPQGCLATDALLNKGFVMTDQILIGELVCVACNAEYHGPLAWTQRRPAHASRRGVTIASHVQYSDAVQ